MNEEIKPCPFYWRKQPKSKEHFLTDEIIRNQFIEDENWDIVTGKAV